MRSGVRNTHTHTVVNRKAKVRVCDVTEYAQHQKSLCVISSYEPRDPGIKNTLMEEVSTGAPDDGLEGSFVAPLPAAGSGATAVTKLRKPPRWPHSRRSPPASAISSRTPGARRPSGSCSPSGAPWQSSSCHTRRVLKHENAGGGQGLLPLQPLTGSPSSCMASPARVAASSFAMRTQRAAVPLANGNDLSKWMDDMWTRQPLALRLRERGRARGFRPRQQGHERDRRQAF